MCTGFRLSRRKQKRFICFLFQLPPKFKKKAGEGRGRAQEDSGKWPEPAGTSAKKDAKSLCCSLRYLEDICKFLLGPKSLRTKLA